MSWRMGRFEARPAERVLLSDGAPLALGARAFDLLLALLERRDRVVTKNELLDLAWPGLVVEENNLAVQIAALRRLLGPTAITTVARRGYRWAEPLDADTLALPRSTDPPGLDRIERRLLAIVVADVVGWTRQVARDPLEAVRRWKAVRAELIEPSVQRQGGRLVELTPEHVQLAFESVVDALAWSLALQAQLADRRLVDAHSALHMRIGIAVDDVIVDDGKLVGEGVHVATGLQQLSTHDEVLVAEPVWLLARQRLAALFEDLGERTVRAVARPLRVFRARAAEADEGAASGVARPSRQWGGRPSLAVMPLRTTDDQADAYFGDGLAEQVTRLLSANRSLFVIAHSSMLRYRGLDMPVAEVAAELGVRYVLTGTLRRAGRDLRIAVELHRPPEPQAIWQQGFSGSDGDVFAFQDHISGQVAAAIDPQVQDAELAQLSGQRTTQLDAYDCLLRGVSGLYAFGKPAFSAAGEFLRRAIALDPKYAQAHAYLAQWHTYRVGEALTGTQGADAHLAHELAMRAVQLDPRDAHALAVAGHVQSFLRQRFTEGLDLFDQALALNPSCVSAWSRSGTTLVYLGRGDEALDRVGNAMRLSPFDRHSFTYNTTRGMANFVCARYSEAIGWLAKSLRQNPDYKAARRWLIAANAQAGDLTEARALAQEFLADDPAFTVSGFAAWYPMQAPHGERLYEGLRRAGLPP